LQEEIILRSALPSDNEALIELTRSSPMISRTGTVYIDRAPDFFALNRARGETRTIVAELGGRPVGYACYVVHDSLVGGKPMRVASAHDFRVDPSLRRHKVGSKVMAELFQRLAEAGCDYIYGMVARGNEQATPFTLGGPGWPQFSSGGLFYNFMLQPFYRPPRTRYQIEPARAEDVPEIVELINTHYSDHNFAPLYTQETFNTMLSSCVGYDIGDLFVARDHGAIVAVLGVWEQSQAKGIVLLRLNPMLSLIFRLSGLIVRLLRLSIKVPKCGERMSSLYVRHAAAREGSEEAFRDLVRWALVHTRRRYGRTRPIFVGAHERDTRLWQGSMFGRGSKLILYYSSLRPGSDSEAEALSTRPFYDDFSLS